MRSRGKGFADILMAVGCHFLTQVQNRQNWQAGVRTHEVVAPNPTSGLPCEAVTISDTLRQRGSRVKSPFHVTDKLIAGMFSREVQVPQTLPESRPKRRDLAWCWK